MLAIWTTSVLLVAALATAMTLSWRRYRVQPVRSKAQLVENGGCYPRVKR